MRKGIALTVLLIAVLSCVGQQLTFCGEIVPIERDKVKNGLLLALKQRQRDMLNTQLQRKAALYLPFIALVLQQYGLPQDLKYLAVTESRLDRHAQSHAGAAGMWQFMPATAAGEGLQIGGGVDERGRVIKSTHAACRLLAKLYRQLGSWSLVAAAYNWGIGNLQRTMNRQGCRDYYALQLNPETGKYLYNVLAFKLLYQAAGYVQDQVRDTTRQLPELPGVPDAKAVDGWQISSWDHHHAEPLPISEKVQDYDTVTVAARLIQDSFIDSNGGALAFSTSEPVQLESYRLPRQSVVKVFIYQLSGRRALLSGAGVDITPELQAYSVLIYSRDGQEGLPIQDTRKITFAAGHQVRLKFIKE